MEIKTTEQIRNAGVWSPSRRWVDVNDMEVSLDELDEFLKTYNCGKHTKLRKRIQEIANSLSNEGGNKD